MKNRLIRLIFLSLSALVVLYLIGRRTGWFRASKPGLATEKPGVSPLPVDAVVIWPQQLENKILTTGTVLPDESVELSSEVPGKITGLYFKEGAYVKQGDLLLTINDAELQAQLRRLKYQESLLSERENRQRQLLDRQAISQDVYDKALTDLNSIRAEIQLVEAQFAKTRLLAPFDGIIGLRYVSPGSYITPNTRIAMLSRVQPVKIEFTIPERYASEVQTGSRIHFTAGNNPEKFEASVYAMEPAINPSTRSLTLRAMFPNTKREVTPGTFASVELVLKTYYNTIKIPSEALLPESGSLRVFLYKSGKAESREVKSGIRTEGMVQIVQGLDAGDTLITTGLLQLRNGMPVVISELN